MNLNYLPKVYVGMPSGTGFPYPDVIMNIYNQTCVRNRDVELFFYKDCIIPKKPVHLARNEILHNFLKSGCHYLWFCDDDNPPALDVLENLLEHQVDFISALVPIRHGDKYLLNVFKNGKHITSYEGMDGPLIEIENCGTGCVLMSREMVQKIVNLTESPYQFKLEDFILNLKTNKPELYKYQDEYLSNWKELYKENNGKIFKIKEYISEDLLFGRTAKELGYKIYADLRSHCTHYKDITKLKVKYENFNNLSDSTSD